MQEHTAVARPEDLVRHVWRESWKLRIRSHAGRKPGHVPRSGHFRCLYRPCLRSPVLPSCRRDVGLMLSTTKRERSIRREPAVGSVQGARQAMHRWVDTTTPSWVIGVMLNDGSTPNSPKSKPASLTESQRFCERRVAASSLQLVMASPAVRVAANSNSPIRPQKARPSRVGYCK